MDDIGVKFNMIVAVSGGHIKGHAKKPWTPECKVVDGKTYVVVDRKDPMFIRFCKNDFHMVDALIQMRNQAVNDAMRMTTRDEDPMAEALQVDGEAPLKKPKRDLIEKVPRVFNVTVKLHTGEAQTASVMSHWISSSALAIELTDENLKLLLQTPNLEFHQFTPVIEQPNVRWYRSRHSVYIRYHNSETSSWMFKVVSVARNHDDEVVQAECEKSAEVLHNYYNENHSTPR